MKIRGCEDLYSQVFNFGNFLRSRKMGNLSPAKLSTSKVV